MRPTFHEPAILAKQAANIDRTPNGWLSLNVVSSWWADEARRYGIHFEGQTILSNRGLRAGLVGTAEQVAERIIERDEAGVGLLLQFSPQLEEMERFSETVMPLIRGKSSDTSP